jgi:CHAT domain-containing protein
MAIVAESTLIRQLPVEPPVPSQSDELAAIASYVRAGRCVLFVGAGLSAGAGLPDWSGLMRRMVAAGTPHAVAPAIFTSVGDHFTVVAAAERARRDPIVRAVEEALGRKAFKALLAERAKQRSLDQPDAGTYLDVLAAVHQDSLERVELERLLRAGRNQEVAARCRDLMGRDDFFGVVTAALAAPATLPATHRDIVHTPFACIVTTNFDDLIERAYLEHRGDRPPAPTGAELDRHGDLLLRGAFFVLKAHGDLAAPDSLVFTADDYRRVVHANPAFQAVMSGILMSHVILFVGYSLGDVNFRLLLDGQLTTFRGRVPPRFAVMSGVGPAERETLWRTARLRVIPYPEGKHEEVGAFVRALSAASAPKGRTTAARSRKPEPAPAGRLFHVLAIASDGDSLRFALERQLAGGSRETLWIGSGTWEGFETLRQRVVETFQEAYTFKEWNARIERAGAALSDLVPAGLRTQLASLTRADTLELVTSQAAEPIPWEWMRVQRSALGLRAAVVRRPVDFTPGARGSRRLGRPLRALILGDAGSGDGRGTGPLAMAEEEADHAARALTTKLRATVTRLSKKRATASRFIAELAGGDYDIVHFAGHAWAQPEDAFLLLWDRVVLGTEIAPLWSRRPPALLVMSTHHTAFFPLDLDRFATPTPMQMAAPERYGEPTEDRGFTALAMRCGVRSFVGCCGSVSDAGSRLVMDAFYTRLCRGETTAAALRGAREQALKRGDATGLQFVAVGDTAFRLTR